MAAECDGSMQVTTATPQRVWCDCASKRLPRERIFSRRLQQHASRLCAQFAPRRSIACRQRRRASTKRTYTSPPERTEDRTRAVLHRIVIGGWVGVAERVLCVERTNDRRECGSIGVMGGAPVIFFCGMDLRIGHFIFYSSTWYGPPEIRCTFSSVQ